MRREHRQPTRAEGVQITSRRPVVRRIPPPGKPHSPDLESLAFTLAKSRYARAVLAESRGDSEKGEEVLEALRDEEVAAAPEAHLGKYRSLMPMFTRGSTASS